MFHFKKRNNDIAFYACAKGKVIALEDVSDPVFAQKMIGDGIAVIVDDELIRAPVEGVLTMIAETKHAFGITTDNGIELLVHIGLETVNLQGKGFQVLAETGSKIEKGQPIIALNTSFFKEKHIELVTPILILNYTEFPIKKLISSPGNEVNQNKILFHV